VVPTTTTARAARAAGGGARTGPELAAHSRPTQGCHRLPRDVALSANMAETRLASMTRTFSWVEPLKRSLMKIASSDIRITP